LIPSHPAMSVAIKSQCDSLASNDQKSIWVNMGIFNVRISKCAYARIKNDLMTNDLMTNNMGIYECFQKKFLLRYAPRSLRFASR
ncbi:hypothetical protein, partial [uncultured Mucilaginibacter sp.]|uniref:hypothetical protein n=1 Tax=uncultured Mucilaginibacter sp. TaxID=797541 RepID=UPI0025EBFADE